MLQYWLGYYCECLIRISQESHTVLVSDFPRAAVAHNKRIRVDNEGIPVPVNFLFISKYILPSQINLIFIT